MKKTFIVILIGLIVLTPLSGCTSTEKSNEKTETQQIEQPKEINIKVNHSQQSTDDDDDNPTTRAIEPEIVTGLKTLNPSFVQEIVINTNMANETTTTDTSVNVDILFVKETTNTNKESVFVDIAKQLRNVKNLKKFTIWSYEEQMYNSKDANKYMMVVYTKYLPTTSDFTFQQLVDSSNNGSVNGSPYFNQNRK
ncbi:MAG: hypothetical protein AB6733_08050 [Clostridiaceae bacterium]